MEDPIPVNPNPNPLQNDDVGLLPIPPMDEDFLAGDLFSPENFAVAGDDFTFGIDLDFTFDDLSFADYLLLEPESDVSHDRTPNSDHNQSPRVFDCSNHGPVSSEESNFGEKSNLPSPDFGNSGVSRDSGNINNNDRDVSSSSFVNNNNNVYNLSEIGGLDWKIEVEGNNKCMLKRKKEQEQGESSDEGGTSKFRRSSSTVETSCFIEEDEKTKARLLRNRESAQLSRQRKKQYAEELEGKVRSMHSTITELNSKISYVMAENATLREQLSGGAGFCPPPPPPGMYHMGMGVPYPWMPYPPYVVKPQGSQVPLVPIPRLKSQQPAPASKVNNKKVERKKNEGKTKKVASISFLGLVFFFLLFGGLVPMVKVRYGGVGDGVSGLQKGTVLMVDNHVDGMGYKGGTGITDGEFSYGRVLQQWNTSDGFGPVGNSTEPLVASLYVPRKDKLVKIDGNLIIHSVLASERAMMSHTDSGVNPSEETSLAIAGRYPPYPIPCPGRNNGRHPHLDGNLNGRQRAIGSGFSDESKPDGSDGKLQEWFREGLAGPMLSSGMCTEVFQFDVSPTPGSIVPATSISNTTEYRQNSTHRNKPRNRRILHELPIPLDGHTVNFTEEHVGPREQNDGLNSETTRSSVVVSVLVDPREAGDGDGEGVIRSKTLPRIFVVVLIDSVKYITYSCMLPFVGSGNHLTT